MELFDAIYSRRAVRGYTDQVVPKPTVMNLLNAAIQAPSAMNSQPWAFVVITGAARLKDISDRAKAHFLKLLTPESPIFGHRDKFSDPETNIFHDAGTLVIICAKAGGLEPAEDCSLAAQNLMLAAHASGLGTCPIGLARPWLNLPETKAELGIPADCTPVFPVVVGFPAGMMPKVARRELEIVNWI
jgi:nitroreductase